MKPAAGNGLRVFCFFSSKLLGDHRLKLTSYSVVIIINIKFDGLVKSPIYFVVGLKRRFAVPYVLPKRRLRQYASYIELFPESISTGWSTFYGFIKFRFCFNTAPVTGLPETITDDAPQEAIIGSVFESL